MSWHTESPALLLVSLLKAPKTPFYGLPSLRQSQEDTAIVHAIMALARSLNLKVTGEGIETAEQADLLGEWGCDRGQGYLFSRTLDSQAAGALLGAAAQQASNAGSSSEAARLVT